MNAYSKDGASICLQVYKDFQRYPIPVKHSFTPSHRGSKILKQMTIHYRKYLAKYDPHLQWKIPQRLLTFPSKPTYNEECDNNECNLILRQNDLLINHKRKITYVIDDLLGKGTFGQVVKCHIEKTNQYVAIKIIKNQAAYNQQCKIEIDILRTLNQYIKEQAIEPNFIIQIQDQFVFKKHACLVFPLLSCNLYDVLKHYNYEGFSVRLVRKFLTQVIQGLIVAEQCGVVHADLKPENIMIEQSNTDIDNYNLKIIDFGSSCFLNRKHPYIYIQSRFYRAPEIILENKSYTNKIDIWSLGCIAVELLCGTALFPCAEAYSCLERIIQVTQPSITNKSYVMNSPVRDKYFNQTGDGYFNLKSREQYLSDNQTQNIQGCYNKKHPIQQLSDLDYYYKQQLDDESKYQQQQDQPSFKVFLKFIQQCLQWEPSDRLTAFDAGLHPFIQGEKQQEEIDFNILEELLETQSNPSSCSSFNEVYQFD